MMLTFFPVIYLFIYYSIYTLALKFKIICSFQMFLFHALVWQHPLEILRLQWYVTSPKFITLIYMFLVVYGISIKVLYAPLGII